MTGSRSTMLTVVALGMLAGSAVGTAAQGEEADPMAPSFFSGTLGGLSLRDGVTERREDGVSEGTGESYTISWDANDPRIAGTATIIQNQTSYLEADDIMAPPGDIGVIGTGLLRIVNDEGSWEGPTTNLQVSHRENASTAGWLKGTGAYEGLSAYVVWSFPGDGTFDGHITAEGPPPAPELPAD